MLRFISVIGITIAMVVGFLAISSQMKDDYSVRSRVVGVLSQMKELSSKELECVKIAATPEVEITSEAEIQPLIGDHSPKAVDEELSSAQTSDVDPADEETSTENTTEFENADIIKTLGYRDVQPGTVEVITIFKDVSGESGKINIKAGSRIVINCTCISEAMSCKTVESDINKNYLPKSLTKQ